MKWWKMWISEGPLNSKIQDFYNVLSIHWPNNELNISEIFLFLWKSLSCGTARATYSSRPLVGCFTANAPSIKPAIQRAVWGCAETPPRGRGSGRQGMCWAGTAPHRGENTTLDWQAWGQSKLDDTQQPLCSRDCPHRTCTVNLRIIPVLSISKSLKHP